MGPAVAAGEEGGYVTVDSVEYVYRGGIGGVGGGVAAEIVGKLNIDCRIKTLK